LPAFGSMKVHGFVSRVTLDRALRARMRRRWRVRTAHALPYLEASALIALALGAGAWLGRML